MTTRQFIHDAFYGLTNKTQCSSVMASGRSIFSYGYHYPLLFTVKGKNIRNVRGYSNTTQRHISWSQDVDAIDIVAPRDFRLNGTDDEILERLIDSQREHTTVLFEQLQAKKRKDTSVYRHLEQRYLKAAANLRELLA